MRRRPQRLEPADSDRCTQSTSLSGSLDSVSCVDPTDCTAVGADNIEQPFYVAESAGVWGTPTQLAWPSGSGSFSAVSCSFDRQLHRSRCGRKRPGLHDRAHLCDGDETARGHPSLKYRVARQSPVWANSPIFPAVSCADSLDCTAVGDTGDMGGNVPVYTTETDGTWSAIETFSGSTSEGDLTAVSCATPPTAPPRAISPSATPCPDGSPRPLAHGAPPRRSPALPAGLAVSQD